MAVVANVAVNVDSKGAVSKLDAVKKAALKLAAAYVTLQAAQKAVNTAIARIESERRLEFLSKGYGEVEKLTKAAAQASERFGQSQTTANKSLADVYARLRPVGTSLEDIVSIYNGFNTAARVSGASAIESENAFRQLSQALGSGALRGDEFNSVSEQVPGILTAISKETGIAQGKLRAYAAQGKITSDVIIQALRRVESEGASQLADAIGGPQQAIIDFQNSVEDLEVAATQSLIPSLADGFRELAIIVKDLEPVFQRIGTELANSLQGLRLFIQEFKGYSQIEQLRQGNELGLLSAITKRGELEIFFGKERFRQLMEEAKAQERLSEGGKNFAQALTEVLQKEIKIKDQKLAQVKAASENTGEANKQRTAVDNILEGQKKLTDEASKYLESVRQSNFALEDQIVALQGAASIDAARIQAAQAINNLERSRLQTAFENAATQKEAVNIAIRLFQNQVKAANLEAQAKLKTIELDGKKLELSAQLQQAKVLEIKAEEQLQKLKAQSIQDDTKRAEKIAEIEKKTAEAVRAQQRVADAAREQIGVQEQIARFQQTVVEATRQTQIETAGVELKQRLVGEQINMSSGAAEKLTNRLVKTATKTGAAATNANSLATSLEGAKTQAEGTATMMIRVATNADRAAIAIKQAINAQAQLNAMQGGGGPKSAGKVQTNAEGGYLPGGFKAFADGGVVDRPTLGLVGEGGESEYIIPASKMAAAMERYSGGARGSSVIPGNGGGNGGSQMPSINPQVSVSTGPVVNMDGQNYVSQDDFVAGLQSASTQGAEMALKMITSSGGARRDLGVG